MHTGTEAFAQKSHKNDTKTESKADSAARARQEQIAAARERQQRQTDSMRAVRQHYTDSVKLVRQHFTDSIAAIRKYKESRHYKDSVEKSRKNKLAAVQAKRKSFQDSIIAARKHITDSAIAVRKQRTDSIRAIQKHRADSLAAIRKYRESKRYRDSVAVVKKVKMDSQKARRKSFNDSMATIRKHRADDMMALRKFRTDSLASIRKKHTDSVMNARKAKTDALAKKKEKAQKDQVARAKSREDRQKLALELKIKKKHEAWSNEKMLKKRWSLPRQVVQNSFSRYNYYFNANRKMDEALQNMQRVKKDNYDSLLALFPFNPDRDSSVLAADMDSIIQKVSLGIQIHDPRTKWGDDLYLLLGQAYFYKGNYTDAATAFRYILSLPDKKKKSNSATRTAVKSAKGKAPSIAQAENKSILSFLQHRSVHNESILWLARTYTQSKQEGNAESVLDLLDSDPNFPGSLQGRLAIEKSFISLNQHDEIAAIEQLGIVAKDKKLPDWIRMRAAFINGQLLQKRGEYAASADNFQQVVDLTPKIDMDFYARKNMAYCMMLSGGNQEVAIDMLKKVLNDGKYTNYYEQVYYVLGRLAANTGNYDDAVMYLRKGISSSKATKKQKAISYATLGDVYYTTAKYMPAKSAYDSAAAFSSAAPGDSIVNNAVKRSLVLGQITGPANTITEQDSLLALSALTRKEQLSVVRKYIKMLSNKRADSIYKAENAGLNTAQNADVNDNANAGIANWYFANATTMQQGFNEFKRKWGNRPLKDSWRRSSSLDFSSNANNNIASNDTSADAIELDENGLPTEDALMVLIPSSDDEKDSARVKIKAAYIALANAYISDLEDYPQAIKTLDTLDAKYPAHEHKAESLYLRYLIAIRQNRLPDAKGYGQRIIELFPGSKWAALVKPTEDGAGLVKDDNSIKAFYDETYDLVQRYQYTEALQRVVVGRQKYNEPRFNKRMQIIEAMALAGTGDYYKADTVITDFLANNAGDTLFGWAQTVKDYINRNKPAQVIPPVQTPKPQAGNAAPQQPSAADVAADASAQAADKKIPELPTDKITPSIDSNVAKAPKEYIYKPGDVHYALFVFGIMEQRTMGVKSAITDFNTFKFGSMNLSVKSEMLETQQGILIIDKFPNASAAKIYLNTLAGTDQVFREYKSSEYKLIMISGDNLMKLRADKNIQPYLIFYKSHYK